MEVTAHYDATWLTSFTWLLYLLRVYKTEKDFCFAEKRPYGRNGIHNWEEGMGISSGKDVVERQGSEVEDRPKALCQSSWFAKGLAKLGVSRAYSVLVRPSASTLIGAGIGIAAILLLTWGSRPTWEVIWDDSSRPPYIHYYTEHLSFFDLITVSEPAVAVALTAFLIGTVLAFFMPVFSVLQALGIAGFMLNFRSGILEDAELGTGYYLAIASTIILMISCKTVYGRRIEDRPVAAIGRIAALSPRATRLSK